MRYILLSERTNYVGAKKKTTIYNNEADVHDPYIIKQTNIRKGDVNNYLEESVSIKACMV